MTRRQYGASPTAVIWVVAILVVLAAVLLYFFGGKNYFSPLKSQATPQSTSEAAEPTALPSAAGSAIPTGTPKPTKSPTPTPTPIALSVTLGSNGDLDGFRSSNNAGNDSLDIRAGRNSNLITRGFISFDIPGTLSGKTIEKATLRLYQGQIIGSPYTIGSSVKVDHVDYGNSLESGDYSISSLSSSFATLTGNAVIEWKDVNVTDQLKDDLGNSRPRSQYRIHFATETIGGTIEGDFAYFESENNSMSTGNRPQLVVKYH